jgi:transposase
MARKAHFDEKELKVYVAEHGVKAARDHYKTSYERIYRIIGDPGIRRPYLDPTTLRRDLRRFEYNVRLLARYYDVHYATVYDWLRVHNIRSSKPNWSKADDAYIKEHAFDRSVSSIAKHLGRSRLAVQNRYHLLGLTVKRMLGYRIEDIAADWGVPHAWIEQARRKHGLPYRKHASKNISYDPEAVWQWLEDGHVLRLDFDTIDKRHYDLRQLYKEARKIFVTRKELFEMGYTRESNTSRKLLKLVQPIYLHGTEGYVYRRSDIFEHMVAHRWSGNPRATKDQWWYQEIIDECARRYVTSQALRYAIQAGRDISINHPLEPKQVHFGLYDRASVIRYLQARRSDAALTVRRLAEYEEIELRCTSNR